MTGPVRVACIGMGWWSDVLADAIVRSGKLEIAACFTRSPDKRAAFAAKYRCRPRASYEEILADPGIEAIINTTPNDVHLATTATGQAWLMTMSEDDALMSAVKYLVAPKQPPREAAPRDGRA